MGIPRGRTALSLLRLSETTLIRQGLSGPTEPLPNTVGLTRTRSKADRHFAQPINLNHSHSDSAIQTVTFRHADSAICSTRTVRIALWLWPLAETMGLWIRTMGLEAQR